MVGSIAHFFDNLFRGRHNEEINGEHWHRGEIGHVKKRARCAKSGQTLHDVANHCCRRDWKREIRCSCPTTHQSMIQGPWIDFLWTCHWAVHFSKTLPSTLFSLLEQSVRCAVSERARRARSKGKQEKKQTKNKSKKKQSNESKKTQTLPSTLLPTAWLTPGVPCKRSRTIQQGEYRSTGKHPDSRSYAYRWQYVHHKVTNNLKN